MFKNYFKVAFRSLNKNRVYALINILGLALGLTVTILIFMFVKDETSYDKHWDGNDRIYRVGVKANTQGQKYDLPMTPSLMAHSLRTEFTDVETATRFGIYDKELLVAVDQNKMYMKNIVYADSAFFKVFDYEFIHGEATSALKDENSIVLTEETAIKLFGNKNAMGEIVNSSFFGTPKNYIVNGIVKEPQGHSHFQFNIFISSNYYDTWWSNANKYTYVKLHEGVNFDDFKEKMTQNFMKKLSPEIELSFKMTLEAFLSEGNAMEYTMSPIKDIHLYSHKSGEIQPNGSIIYIFIFIGIALMVILIAGINFMNLSTARAGKRAKEVGVRKVVGASRKMLITQFLTESVIQSFMALFIAFILVELFLPGFNNIMETDINLFNDYFAQTLLFSIIIAMCYGLFAGSYPALFISAFAPIDVLKGDLTKTKSGALLRKGLVVIQFSASTILIIGMIIIFNQISFMKNKDLGFNGNQVLILPIKTVNMSADFDTYKNRFLQNSKVLDVSRAMYFPGDNREDINRYTVDEGVEKLLINNMGVDYDFFKSLDIELLEGRLFEKDKEADSTRYFIVNQTAAKYNNIKIGSRIGYPLYPTQNMGYGNVIGIVKDFHTKGFNEPIKPMILYIDQENCEFASIKIAPEDMNSTINFIEKEWNKLEPSRPFKYEFLDAKFGALMRQQENFGIMFLFLTILAIIISAMGLYGLASYTAEQRTKEIGIRKVLGASVGQIMNMLTKDFMKLVLIANIFAWPITYLLAKDWLSNFSYQIDMPILPFIFATLLTLIIAIITVSSQAYKAANSDPVNALKYE